MVIASVLANLSGLLVFLFIFWKKLKDDYTSDVIFLSTLYILVGLLTGFLISLKFFGDWFFWIEFLGVAAGLCFAVFKFKIRIYETLEAAVIGFLPWFSLFLLKDSVLNSSLISFVAFLVSLFLIFVYYFLDSHYKEFAWYKSGKIGFAGLATLGIFFLVRCGVAIFFRGVLSFVVGKEPFISGGLAFVCFLMIFNLGRQQ